MRMLEPEVEMKTAYLFFALLLINCACHAGVLSNEKKPTVTYQQKKYSLTKKGKGIRIKKIAFISVSVYEAQLYATDVTNISSSNTQLNNRDQQFAIELTFLRSVDGEKIMNAYLESLKANNVKVDSPSIQQFLNIVKSSGEISEKNKITIVGLHLEDGNDLIIYEDQKNKVSELTGKGLVQDIFSIWLGKTTDDQLENLKKDLLK